MLNLLKKALEWWQKDRAMLLAGALAYHTVFAIAPLLLLVIAVIGILLNEESAQRAVVIWVENAAGRESAGFVVTALETRNWMRASWTASLVSLGIILFASVGLLGTLRVCLNAVWHVEPKPSRSWLHTILKGIGSLLMVLVAGGLLLISTIVSALVTTFLDAASSYVLLPPEILGVLQFLLFFLLSTVLFLAIFKTLPDARIAWSDALAGAAFTGLLFVVGASLLTWVVAWSGFATAYGAAGSVIALLMWVYYSSQILLFGAVCTRVYAEEGGSRISPDSDARRTDTPLHIEIPRVSVFYKARVAIGTVLLEIRVLKFLLWLRRKLRKGGDRNES